MKVSTLSQSEPASSEPYEESPPRGSRRTYLRPRRGWQALPLQELWQARDLIWMIAIRDVKVRYKQTFFGFAWAVVVPAVQVIIFSVFFGHLLGVGDRVDKAVGRPIPYPLFALSGQLVWNFFSGSVNAASSSLTANAAIIRKIYVPRLGLPVAAIAKPVVDSAIVFVLMVVLTAGYIWSGHESVWWTPRILLAPLLLALSVIPGLGMGLLLAALTVNFRDLRYILPFMIQTLFYVTPVIYPVDILPDQLEWLIYLNPIAGFVEAHRACVMDLPMNYLGLGVSTALSAVLLVAGAFYFSRVEREFADVA